MVTCFPKFHPWPTADDPQADDGVIASSPSGSEPRGPLYHAFVSSGGITESLYSRHGRRRKHEARRLEDGGMASHYIGPTTSGTSAGSGENTDVLYARVGACVTSSEFQDEYAACGRRLAPRRN